jgi:carboxypeptidase family protein
LKAAPKSLVLALALVVIGALAAPVSAQRRAPGGQRTVTGHVYGNNDAPLEKAIVYIKNTKSLAVKTYITERDGTYRFTGLTQNVDYDVYADYNGKHSSTRTVSSFDDRPEVYLNLHIDVAK